MGVAFHKSHALQSGRYDGVAAHDMVLIFCARYGCYGSTRLVGLSGSCRDGPDKGPVCTKLGRLGIAGWGRRPDACAHVGRARAFQAVPLGLVVEKLD